MCMFKGVDDDSLSALLVFTPIISDLMAFQPNQSPNMQILDLNSYIFNTLLINHDTVSAS